MKIIGIDASLTGTGVAVLDGSLRTETIQSKQTGPARLIEIRDRIRELVDGAVLVAIEGYSFSSHSNTAYQLGELGGVLRVMLAEAGVRWIEVAPAQLKKFAAGRGNAKKEELAVAIYKRWGREFWTNDEADAFVLVVSDDGRGFSPEMQSGEAPESEAKRISGGHGLKNIAKRLREIGGHCEVVSRPGQGTEIRLRVPLPPEYK